MMLYPCPHFDKHKDVPGPTCPHDILTYHGDVDKGAECSHWMENYEDGDVFAPCREFTPEYRCDKTLDMFEEDEMNKILFYVEGRPVFKGNILFVDSRSDQCRTGLKITAEFDGHEASAGEVTVRTDNGAVPSIDIKKLSWTKPILKCLTCGQVLPEEG